jgi:16S rRNA (uracil1498-N3)-methyltransferase
MPRFFVKPEDISDGTVNIYGEDSRHIARSLRMAVGDSLTVCDTEGTEYETVLERIRDDACTARILSGKVSSAESPVRITLYMAYPKSDKLETVIQKAVELGAAEIIPFESSRCIKRPSKDKADKRNERLCRIAAEAAKQCGRARIPTVRDAMDFSSVIDSVKKYDIPIFCYEGEGALSLKTALKGVTPGMSICAVVGSEGGFSKEEAAIAMEAGFIITNLGPRILRCETAPSYVLSAISYELEL